jgi:hypothetical protein
MHVHRVKDKTHFESLETSSDKRFCGTKCFDSLVIFEVRHVESFQLGDSLGSSIFQCNQSLIECPGEDVQIRSDLSRLSGVKRTPRENQSSR